jgi:hypothetical protein
MHRENVIAFSCTDQVLFTAKLATSSLFRGCLLVLVGPECRGEWTLQAER